MESGGNDLTIQLFFFTSAIFAGVEAVKANGWRAWLFGGLAGLFAITGAAWPSLKEIYPPLSRSIGEVASSPQAWFTLIVLALAVVALTGRKARATATSSTGEPIELPEWLSDVPGRLDDLAGKLDRLAKAVAQGSLTQSGILDSLQSRAKELSDRLRKVETLLQPRTEGLLGMAFDPSAKPPETRFDNIEAKIDRLRDHIDSTSLEIGESIADIQAALEAQRESHRQLHDRAFAVFRAKQAEHRMEQLIPHLEEAGEVLSAPTLKRTTPVDFGEWSSLFTSWQVALHEFCRVVKPYYPEAETKLLATPIDAYKGAHWTVDEALFANHDQVHDYKTFRILLRNFDSLKPHIIVSVKRNATV